MLVLIHTIIYILSRACIEEIWIYKRLFVRGDLYGLLEWFNPSFCIYMFVPNGKIK